MISTDYMVELEAAAIDMRKRLAEIGNLLKGGSYKLSPSGPLSDCVFAVVGVIEGRRGLAVRTLSAGRDC